MPINGTALQANFVTKAAGGFPATASFTATPSVGNLLIACVAVSNSSASFSIGPGDWNKIYFSTGGNASRDQEAGWWWKECSGTEKAITVGIDGAASAQGGSVIIAEFSGESLDLSGLANSNFYADKEDTAAGLTGAMFTGTATNTNAVALALAFFAEDNNNTDHGVVNYTNSFSEQIKTPDADNPSHCYLASKVLSVSAGNFCSVSQSLVLASWGSISIFSESAGASNTVDTITDPITAGQSATYSGTLLQNVSKVLFIDGSGVGTATANNVTASSTSGGVFTAPTEAQMVAGDVKFKGLTAVFRDGTDSAIASISTSIIPSSAYLVHNVTSLISQSTSSCIYFGLSASVSDQFLVRAVTASHSWSVSIGTTGIITVDSGGSNLTDWIIFNVYDETTNDWGATATIVVTVAPLLSTFTAGQEGTNSASLGIVTNLLEGTIYGIASTLSGTPLAAQIIAGLDANSITAAWAGSITVDTLNETLAVGGLDGAIKYFPFLVQVNLGSLTSSVIAYAPGFTTEATGSADITPDQFTFTDLLAQEFDTEVTSNEITVNGVTAMTSIDISVQGGEYAVDSGGGYGVYTTNNGSVQLGYLVKVKHTTDSDALQSVNTTLNISGVTDTFSSTTKASTELTSQNIWQWILAQGYSGGIMKQISDYMLDQGYSSGATNTKMFNWLRGQGYTGSLNSMINQFERDNTGRYGS